MRNFIYAPESDDKIDEFLLVTRSLLLLAFLTGVLYARVFITAMYSAFEADGLEEPGFLSLVFLGTAMIGLLAAWRWAGPGGIVTLGSGVALAVLTFVTAADAPWVTAFFYGSPFIITGFLCLVYWWKGRKG